MDEKEDTLSDDTWPAPSSSTDDEEMPLKEIDNFDQDDMTGDDMDNRLKDEPLEDTADSQGGQFDMQMSSSLPTKKPQPSTQLSSKDPLKIHQQMIRPWGNQHAKHHYRNPDLLSSEIRLSGKETGDHQHQSLELSSGDKLGHYDDGMDWMNSITWDDQGLEGGTRDMSSTNRDIDYGDMTDDYKDPYGSMSNGLSKPHEESYGGNEGISSTYRETSNENMMDIYEDTDSKAYPKQPGSLMDNMELTDQSLEEHTKDLNGFDDINGVSSEGGLGLPVQEYMDEMGQVRRLHKSSTAENLHKSSSHKKNKGMLRKEGEKTQGEEDEMVRNKNRKRKETLPKIKR